MNRPDVKVKTKLAMKEVWKNPDVREKHRKSKIRAMSNPDVIAKMKEAKRKPEVRDKMSKAAIESWKNQEIKQKRLLACKNRPKTTETRLKNSLRAQESQNRPEVKLKKSVAMKELWKKDEFIENQIKLQNSYEIHRKKFETYIGGFWYGNVRYYNCERGFAGRVRRLGKYQRWRNRVFKRDGYCDFYTGEDGDILDVHHIEPFVAILDKYEIRTIQDALNCSALWDVKNGVTMVKKNHTIAFHKFIKENHNDILRINGFTRDVMNHVREFLQSSVESVPKKKRSSFRHRYTKSRNKKIMKKNKK
jgi:hypothetical protein